VAQKSEICFCPKSRPQIQHSTTTTDQMIISGPLFIILTVSGPLFIILLIHWELVKGICRLFLGHLVIGSLKKLTCFAPSLGHIYNTPQPPRTR
jgi:hypothetical protein